jgi:Flp pilus assembly protein TadG
MNEIGQGLSKPNKLSIDELPSAAVRGPARRTKARQGGTIAVMFIAVFMVIMGFAGLALELSQLYNRKVEMQSIADAIALAAARNLNGSPAGINAAMTAAAQTAALFSSGYGKFPISWSPSAISFSTSPDRYGTWVDSGTAAGMSAQMFYVRVDTSQLGGAPGTVQLILMPALSSSLSSIEMNSTAVAGRSVLDVTPLAVCAMSASAASSRPNSGGNNELVEYGFRRGVSYDLMRLNPSAATPPAPVNYVVNPIVLPGATGAAADTSVSTVGPYICAGAVASPRLLGGEVPVSSSFPIGSLYQQLNSRFDQYTGNLCDFNGAPPDRNIKAFVYTSIPWVNTTPLDGQRAAESTPGNTLVTIADLAPPGGTAKQYGPVWTYARAVQYAATPPAGGYTAFATGAWPNLYGGQTSVGYPGGVSTPYTAVSGVNFSGPNITHRPITGRRVLNIPLLSCPVPAGTNVSATVLAIGRFFMTVPATSTNLYGEFAGAVPLANVTGEAELF